MAIAAGLAILLLSLSALLVEGIRSVPAVTGDAPDFCHNADCPKFTTKEEHDEYDIREYEPGVTRRSTRRCGLACLSRDLSTRRSGYFISAQQHVSVCMQPARSHARRMALSRWIAHHRSGTAITSYPHILTLIVALDRID